MKRKRIRRGPTLGGFSPSWRWEVAAPLAFIGVVIAGVGATASGGAFLFWLGVALVAIAAVAFSAGS